MDYGHTTPPADLQEFSKANGFESDNLNLNNSEETAWDQPMSVEHDRGTIGGKVNSSLREQPSEQADFLPMPDQEAKVQNLGQVTDLEPHNIEPHDMPTPQMTEDAISLNENITKIADPSLFREEKGRISHHTVQAVERDIEKYNKGEFSPSEIADERWESVKKYMGNSFKENSALNGYKEAAWRA